jgi:hypothetical protein
MSEPISGLVSGAMSQHLKDAARQAQQQGAGSSFESVLQKAGQPGAEPARAPEAQASQVKGAELAEVPEQARQDLIRRVGALPQGSPNVLALLPELFEAKTRTGWLREALSGMGNTPKATDLRGTLGHVESEWNQFDAILKSGKDMSQADLLTLQGRLYQLTQHVEVLSKVVDQVTGGVKTILNTNV